MKNKTILITGASKGIGASFSNFLASKGYRIIGIARDKDQLMKTFNSLPNQNLNHDILPIDITNFNLVKEKLINMDVYCLINNAGIAQSNLLQDVSTEEFNQIININLVSALNISNILIPKMILNKKGRIINISSILGLSPLKFVGAYSMSKAALIQMTKSQSIELAKYNILVNALCPGYIITDINRSFLESDKSFKLKSKIPLDRFATCDELLPSLKMLVDPNNSYMTGSIITIDGGMNSTL
tara:strand:- start:970 stop:1698 length:729 start_codon:yes stop_codon:yes gene_type:complete